MKLEVRCRRCGRAFEPDRKAIMLGRWRLCPDCQDPTPTGGVPAEDSPFRGSILPEAA